MIKKEDNGKYIPLVHSMFEYYTDTHNERVTKAYTKGWLNLSDLHYFNDGAYKVDSYLSSTYHKPATKEQIKLYKKHFENE